MNLYCKKLETLLQLSPLTPIALTIEEPILFAEMVQELFALSTNSSKLFSVMEYGKLMATHNAIILDYINFTTSKATTTALQKSLTTKLNNNGQQLNEWIYAGYQMLQALCMDYTADVVVDANCKTSNIFKLYDVGVECDASGTLIEKLISYINCMVEFESLNVLILVSPKDYFNRADYAELIKHCAYKEVCLVAIQSHIAYSFAEEQNVIVDKDLCEIVDKQVRL